MGLMGAVGAVTDRNAAIEFMSTAVTQNSSLRIRMYVVVRRGGATSSCGKGQGNEQLRRPS